MLKQIVDSLDPTRAVLVLPFTLLLAYGAAAAVHDALRGAARHRLRARDAARRAAHRADRVPPPARAVAALSPRAADGRRLARHRARHPRHLDAAVVHAVLDHPGDARIRRWSRPSCSRVRLAFHRSHVRRGRSSTSASRSRSPSGARRSAADATSSTRAPTPGPSTACSTTRPSSTSTTRNTRRAATTRTSRATKRAAVQDRGFARAAQHRAELHHCDRGDRC